MVCAWKLMKKKMMYCLCGVKVPNITFQNGLCLEIDEEEDDVLFVWSELLANCVKPYFQAGPLSEVITIANLPHAASRKSKF